MTPVDLGTGNFPIEMSPVSLHGPCFGMETISSGLGNKTEELDFDWSRSVCKYSPGESTNLAREETVDKFPVQLFLEEGGIFERSMRLFTIWTSSNRDSGS
jgi:hypothetical protein